MSQTWMACHKFYKRYTLVIELKKQHRLYNFGTSVFFKFNFNIKIYFCYFLVPN